MSSAPEHAHQFRLERLQCHNWGTFSGLFDFPIPKEGYLFVGPSGSGKSTLLDAHAALLTPPKWVDFNVAAREAERQGKDRSLMTYVRGAWAQQSGEGREVISQMLREGSTWTALAETYRNGENAVVVIAQVFWVRGKSSANADVQRVYLVLQQELELSTLAFFPASDFDVRRFKVELPRAFITREFSGYQERFRSLLGIDSERALRLLHKTQSAKNLGELDAFMRNFMLDEPETFATAERLVHEFGELHAAHQAVVDARRQIETLLPAQLAHQQRAQTLSSKLLVSEISAGVDSFREQQRTELLQARLALLQTDAAAAHQNAAMLADLKQREFDKLTEVKRRRYDSGGGLIEDLERQQDVAERARPERLRKRELAQSACLALGWTLPEDVHSFVRRTHEAQQHVHLAAERQQQIEARKDAHKREQEHAQLQFIEVVREVRAMEQQRSNIPARLLEARATIARALGISEDRLPFAGELLEVRADQGQWQGAIERVLGGFARSMLVEERHYAPVATFLNEHNTGEHLFYNRVSLSESTGSTARSSARPLGANSLVRKLDIAPGAMADWLRDELKSHFDFECAPSLQAFRAATRALTQQGQIKRDVTRHEKNDRQRVDDRSRWVLGFDNREKLLMYQQRAAALGAQIADCDLALKATRADEAQQRQRDFACNTLQNLRWDDIDVAALIAQGKDLKRRIQAELAARPDLAVLDQQIAAQSKIHERVANKQNDEQARAKATDMEIAKLQKRLVEQQSLSAQALSESQLAGVQARLGLGSLELTLDNLDRVIAQLEKQLAGEDKQLELKMVSLQHAVEARFAEFNREFPAESGGLDAALSAAPDYFVKLARLQTDGLPKFEQRFMQLLREQSDQNLTLLSSKLDQERSAIRARMELVNESLLDAPFNKGTHLVIDTMDRMHEDVRSFKQSLRDALSYAFVGDAQAAELRFAQLNAIVKRLSSQDYADRQWRALVLDVREHVSFMARELDAQDVEVEVYRSGAGKSGGQRQKLTATCLAAALRYQLGGQDRAWPAFATVVMDEAFDKADAEFTAMAVNIFNTFGFQMIVATPLKSVMTLEPFIGGACYVHNTDRKVSSVLRIEYDHANHRLELPVQLKNQANADSSATRELTPSL